jgi:hypothetical protein
MKERYKSHLYAAQTGCTVLFCLVILCGCRVTKIKTACLRGVSENTASIERKILQQIDSVYKSIPDIKYKKIVGSRCINDTIIEVKVLNANFTYGLFYFNNIVHLIEVNTLLPPVY